MTAASTTTAKVMATRVSGPPAWSWPSSGKETAVVAARPGPQFPALGATRRRAPSEQPLLERRVRGGGQDGEAGEGEGIVSAGAEGVLDCTGGIESGLPDEGGDPAIVMTVG